VCAIVVVGAPGWSAAPTRLRLDVLHALDSLELADDRLLRREGSRLPRAKVSGVESDNNLELEGAEAHDW
jgi:hypothetical protein